MVIRVTDRVSAVLARDERLIEVFASLAPTFEKLRNPAMRRMMARLVTVEQAARVAGIEPGYLVERLNHALEGDALPIAAAAVAVDEGAAETGVSGERTTSNSASSSGSAAPPRGLSDQATPVAEPTGPPASLTDVPSELIVDLDVRPDLRRGEEPFSKIMAARRQVPPGGVLRLRATFEPVPLYAVLGKQGFEHWTESLAADDWRVWFYRRDRISTTTATSPADGAPIRAGTAGESPIPHPGTSAVAPTADPAPPHAPAIPPPDPAGDVVILDVRDLEPPEPMMRTFEALEQLPRGKTLVQINVRVPQFLLPQLAARGFTYEIREQSKDLVRLFIRHAGEA